ncbi:arginine-tRNA-protein transferase [Roseimicrobium gellanilyticum]|uniref:Arginine-tRNA-protein transferase n=1 Tax=Roseimicrobium gellanilyticum TaxID=748857 RepID=A0A366H1G1_9BACT|nr:arginine-tRNA-protein transferase [Roseimicrobium gellanilyticum]RBP35714.1 arginine-tRNA-protein transferase [Roseimicrobium gellanilyticum]
MSLPPLIWDTFQTLHAAPQTMDELWAEGWRHFGAEFFRYSVSPQADGWQTIVPLRLHLAELTLTKSQRRVLRKNEDVELRTVPATLSEEAKAMFLRHKARFTENIPEALTTFLSTEPNVVPCRCMEFQAWVAGELAAISYLDLGEKSVSSVYGMFEPAHAKRSLGIYTLLQEMLWAQAQGFALYYPGYATHGSSAYDYKKQLHGLEGYCWREHRWMPREDIVAETWVVGS